MKQPKEKKQRLTRAQKKALKTTPQTELQPEENIDALAQEDVSSRRMYLDVNEKSLYNIAENTETWDYGEQSALEKERQDAIPAVIEIKSLTKVYDGQDGPLTALSDVNLTVQKGDIYGIIGLSGAGKSTLVRCINLLEKPTQGTVRVNGDELTAIKRKKQLLKARRKIGMIFQNYNLLEQRTVLKNVLFPLEIQGMRKKAAKKRAVELLEMVGLSDKLNAYPSQLSGGQKQRVAIARALAPAPTVLLCDEATSALDPSTTDSILSLLKEINQKLGVTVVIITHEMKIVEKICNKVAVIDESRIAESGLVSQIFINPQSDIARKLIMHVGAKADDSAGKKLRLIFDGSTSDEPIISLLALNCGITANISFASTRDVGGKIYGEMVVRLPSAEDSVDKAKRFLRSKGVICKEEK